MSRCRIKPLERSFGCLHYACSLTAKDKQRPTALFHRRRSLGCVSELADQLALGLADEFRYGLLVASAMQEDQSAHTELGEPPGGVEVDPAAWRHADLKIVEGPPGLLACCAQALDAFGSPFHIQREAEPPVGKPRRPAVSFFGVTAENDLRVRLLHAASH